MKLFLDQAWDCVWFCVYITLKNVAKNKLLGVKKFADYIILYMFRDSSAFSWLTRYILLI